jgi:hypothetical protein
MTGPTRAEIANTAEMKPWYLPRSRIDTKSAMIMLDNEKIPPAPIPIVAE